MLFSKGKTPEFFRELELFGFLKELDSLVFQSGAKFHFISKTR